MPRTFKHKIVIDLSVTGEELTWSTKHLSPSNPDENPKAKERGYLNHVAAKVDEAIKSCFKPPERT